MKGQKISPTISTTIGSTNGIRDLPVASEEAREAKRAGARAGLGEVKFERRWIIHGLFS